MAFGISFGKKKSSTNETTNIDKTTTTAEQQSGTTQSTQTQTGTTNTQGQTASQGQSVNTQTTDNTVTGTTGGQQSSITQQFSDDVLAGLDSAVLSAIGQAFGTNGAGNALSSSIQGLGDFNAEDFINKGLAAAATAQANQVGEFTRGAASGIGGTADTNSMVALLQQRAQNESATALGGVYSDLTARAAEIENQRVSALSGATGTEQNALAQILYALKGGVSATEGTTAEQTSQNQTGTNVGLTETSEQSQTAQQQQTQQTTQLLEIIQQLLSGTSREVGTENTVGKTKSGGGGLRLGI